MKLKTYQITIDALLAAMCAVLGGVLMIDLQVVKITLESYPVFLAAMMYGPVDGMLVGGIGTLIYQLLGPYGITPTTPLWILPYIIAGAAVGLYAKKHSFNNTPKQIRLCICLMELLILVLNTGVIYVDSNIYGYYSFSYVFGAVGYRVLISVGKAVLFGIFTPGLLKRLSRYTHNGRGIGSKITE